MLANFWKIREVKEVINAESVNELLARDNEDWVLLDIYVRDNRPCYVIARHEEH